VIFAKNLAAGGLHHSRGILSCQKIADAFLIEKPRVETYYLSDYVAGRNGKAGRPVYVSRSAAANSGHFSGRSIFSALAISMATRSDSYCPLTCASPSAIISSAHQYETSG